MELPTTMQGRPFGSEQLVQVQDLIVQQSDWSRWRLSRELARLWNWRTPRGQLKDMAARTLLLKLHQQGRIQLPAQRWKSPTRSGRPVPCADPVLDHSPIAGPLSQLLPLGFEEVSQKPARRQLEAALQHHHYLGYRSRVGQNLQYWVSDGHARPLGCVVFGAPAWQCAVRDQWIGWSPSARARQLGQILNNTRFLLFSWVRVAHLANYVLSQISRRVPMDWQAKYGQPMWLLETFVDRQRFGGACYRAANWIHLGQTCGRGRQGPAGRLSTSIKDVYVLPLHPNFRDRLNLI